MTHHEPSALEHAQLARWVTSAWERAWYAAYSDREILTTVFAGGTTVIPETSWGLKPMACIAPCSSTSRR